MGSDVHSSASLTIAEDHGAASALERAVTQLLELPELSPEFDPSWSTLEIIASALAAALDIPADEHSTALDRADGRFEIYTSGWGRPRAVDETLQIRAAAGLTGTVNCEDERYERWRHRIDHDGQVHRDDATTVYSGGPITEVWIVQMQSTDDSDLDHVAVVGAERDAEAILAGWVRTEARALIASGTLAHSRIDLDVDDAALLAQWADVGGVKWDVYQPK
ncbi:hypothetical protein O4328_28860 [Rhodococcus opacus]|uniref:Uncharacterized protein n=1 Tax=Rhodococcus opacus TaxID=37919 RepID=A0AAX3YT92_RHOOP|nr:hypothetical protein [Rhodococcus opacus]MCZ4587652.1 hypothetical protein [Rhodococcus opacus]WLF51352.1 hypothetical protein Q5707_37400 [Rhodococcus opacus]